MAAAASCLVLEVAHAGGQQGNAILVADIDGILVTQGATGVDNGSNAGLAGNLNRVVPGEGEEGIRGQDRALDLVTSLLQGDADRVDTVGLARAHAQQLAILGNSDGVGLDVLDGPAQSTTAPTASRSRLQLTSLFINNMAM